MRWATHGSISVAATHAVQCVQVTCRALRSNAAWPYASRRRSRPVPIAVATMTASRTGYHPSSPNRIHNATTAAERTHSPMWLIVR